jgi:hypothetical protein
LFAFGGFPQPLGQEVGTPTANVYATTAVFVLGDDVQVEPEWPANASTTLSILLEKIPEIQEGLQGFIRLIFWRKISLLIIFLRV